MSNKLGKTVSLICTIKEVEIKWYRWNNVGYNNKQKGYNNTIRWVQNDKICILIMFNNNTNNK